MRKRMLNWFKRTVVAAMRRLGFVPSYQYQQAMQERHSWYKEWDKLNAEVTVNRGYMAARGLVWQRCPCPECNGKGVR